MMALPRMHLERRFWLAWLRRSASGVLLVLLLASAALAQDKRDGHYWRTIPESEKIDIILGIFDGLALAENVIEVVLKENYTICTDVIVSIMGQTDRFLDNLTTTDISGRLDKFYEQPNNRDIPIFWGVWVVARESKGDKTVPKFLRELRKAYK